MNDLAAHRGPDDSGAFFGSNFALAHRRLAIIDISEAGHQPMCYGDRFWIVYNGELYNYIEIRNQLRLAGYRFRSESDTEVILAAWCHWGAKSLERFNGMFAFAIYDAKKNCIILARDRFGEKPLHYTDTDVEFRFGSEIKQLLNASSVNLANRDRLTDYLLTRLDGHTTDTMFAGVSCLPGGHYLVYSLATYQKAVYKYYQLVPSEEAKQLNITDASHRLRELLEDSIRIRLRSDVTVGTCLSGGLDSSAVCGFASRLRNQLSAGAFLGIHSRSMDSEFDESRHAQAVAKHLDMSLSIVEPSVTDFIRNVDEVVYTQEEPFGSPSMFMGWHVFRRARELGCTVMLNGQGADEALLGYERYFAAFFGRLGSLEFFRQLVSRASNSAIPKREIFAFYLYFNHPRLREWLVKRRSFVRREIKEAHDYSALYRSAESFQSVESLQIHELMTLQLPHLLRYEDRSSMMHSIETRLPFLDHRLIEFCVGLNPMHKIHDGWTKYVLRLAVDDILPNSVTWRRGKLGFQAPERSWLGANVVKMREEVAASRILNELTDREKIVSKFFCLGRKEQWAYFNLAVWERVFNVRW